MKGSTNEFETAGFAGGGADASTDAAIASADSAPPSVRSGALEDMERGRRCAVSGACHWAVKAAASASHGKMWARRSRGWSRSWRAIKLAYAVLT